MAALTAANMKIERLGNNPQSVGQATATTIFQGGIVMINAGGFATPGATATGCVGVGVADDNGGLSSWVNAGADGASNVTYTEGVHGPFVNSGTSIADDDRGKDCYIVDDQTVHLTDGGGTRSPAGRVHSVASAGVFVEMSAAIARQITEAQIVSTGQAYTQTYSTANRTVAAPTAASAAAATVGADIGVFTDPPTAGEMAALRTFVNALKADVAALRTPINALVIDDLDNRQTVSALIDDLQTAGIVS